MLAVRSNTSRGNRTLRQKAQGNHNLEEQAQALYKSWFVDFEPFKGGKFIKSSAGLIPETWATQRICDLPLYISDYVSNVVLPPSKRM